MDKKILFSLFGVAALVLSACGGSEATKPSVDDKSVGADAAGTGRGSGADGKSLDSKADMLAKRRVYFAFDSSAVDAENRVTLSLRKRRGEFVGETASQS